MLLLLIKVYISFLWGVCVCVWATEYSSTLPLTHPITQSCMLCLLLLKPQGQRPGDAAGEVWKEFVWSGGSHRECGWTVVDGWMDGECRLAAWVDVGRWRVRGGRGPVDQCT